MVASVEEQENVRKEEAARLSSEVENEVETKALTEEGGLSRSLALLRALIVSVHIQTDAEILSNANQHCSRSPNG